MNFNSLYMVVFTSDCFLQFQRETIKATERGLSIHSTPSVWQQLISIQNCTAAISWILLWSARPSKDALQLRHVGILHSTEKSEMEEEQREEEYTREQQSGEQQSDEHQTFFCDTGLVYVCWNGNHYVLMRHNGGRGQTVRQSLHPESFCIQFCLFFSSRILYKEHLYLILHIIRRIVHNIRLQETTLGFNCNFYTNSTFFKCKT